MLNDEPNQLDVLSLSDIRRKPGPRQDRPIYGNQNLMIDRDTVFSRRHWTAFWRISIVAIRPHKRASRTGIFARLLVAAFRGRRPNQAGVVTGVASDVEIGCTARNGMKGQSSQNSR